MRQIFQKSFLALALILGFTIISFVHNGSPAYAASENVGTLEELKSKLEDALKNKKTTLSIVYTGGKLSKEQVNTNINDALKSVDDYSYYSNKTWGYSFNYLNETTVINYSFTYWETLEQTQAVSTKVTEVLSTIITPGMNDFQKEKAIHDWIETNLSYDTSLVQHSAYAGLFGNKKTVCQGYALLTYKMLTEVGIENKIVEGMAGTTPHAWNLVKLDGVWYHLDTTWDDPVPDVTGRVIFDHYNLTDNQIKAVHTWTKTYPTANTSFENTLNDKIISDAVNAPFYQELKGLLDLHFTQPEYTVSNSTELAAKIQKAMSTHEPTFKVRHTNKSAVEADLKAAIAGFSNISGYSFSKSDYLRSESTTDSILTVNLNYTDPIPVTGVTINASTTEVKVGGTLTLTSTTQPVNASIKGVTWTSSNSTVATVSSTGVVTGKSVGTVTITATTQDGGFIATKNINVYAPVTGVTLNKTTLSLKKGDPDFNLVATILPTNAYNKNVTWSTSNAAVATVDSNGVVHAVASGTATITVKTADGGKTAVCTVTVPYSATGVSFSKKDVTASIGTTTPLTATVSPTNAINKAVTWTSSDTSIATVSTTGVVTPLKVGTVTITVKTTDGGFTDSATVKVVQPVTSLTLNKTALTLKTGDPDETLVATVGPETATDKSLTWTSSNPSVATVDANGKVHPVASGTATITVKSVTGAKVATATITVPFSVNSISLSKSDLTVNVAGTAPLTVVFNPTTATNKNVTWTSSDPTIATVSTTGVVTGKAVGTATITATTVDGLKTATATIKVVQPVTSLTLNKTALTLKAGDPDIALVATVGPVNATDKSLTWTSSNPSVATVDSNGNVHAVASGTATITVKSVLGAKVATATVTVAYNVNSITLSKTDLTVNIGTPATLTAIFNPTNATNKNVTWTSSDPTVATVSTTGAITGKSVGTAIITATTVDGGKTATATVKVVQPVTSLTLNKTAVTFKVGDPDVTLIPTIGPANATDKSLIWTSSKPTVATVDANGVVHAVASGTATITVKSVSGAKVATAAITVAYEVSSITLNKTDLTVSIGTPATLTAVINPTNATNKNVIWTSSDPTVATVSTTGAITGKAVGTATITATTVDGGKTATATVNVVQPVTSLTLDKTVLTIKAGDSDVTLVPTVGPVNATDKSLIWTSSNPAVATVDANGVVHAVAPGTARITVKSVLGAKVATATVTVPTPVTKVTLNKSDVTLNRNTTASLIATVEPVLATTKTVTWSSSDSSVATVSSTGVITAKSAGTAIITVTTTDGAKTATVLVTVI